jgi:hypothetical protein
MEPILCELNPFEELAERRMLVEKPIVISCDNNMAIKKLIQVFRLIHTFSLIACQKEMSLGILEHSVTLMQGEGHTKKLLKEMGWSLLEQMRCLPQIDECPTPNNILMMNIILWNCRGALKPSF